ncbi:MAG: peroxiredoxin [Rhizobiales bacterium]|nr:peroxiredoxin [Hyphomicrobiales bacterium]MBI3673224.1 peroxiredoxin [Hyphomicrobiales bacterium]
MFYLVGRRLPDVMLPATSGMAVSPARLDGPAVIFCYPWTGRPGHADPPHWDEIPGAHGSTRQAIAYSEAYGTFRRLGVKLFGLSLQEIAWQQEFVRRNSIGFRFLSDAERKFSGKLGLPRIETGGVDYLQRLTFVTQDGVITHVRFPVPDAERDAAEVLAMFVA